MCNFRPFPFANPKAIILALLPLFFTLSCTSLSDIRPLELKESGLNDDRKSRGHLLLEQMQEAHGGLENWKSKTAMRVLFRDDWPGFWSRTLASPWPEAEQGLLLCSLLGTDTGYIQQTNGPKAGLVWGLQNWVTYTRQTPDTAPVFKHDDDVLFWIPTVTYFMELPFRVGEAEIIAHAGQLEKNGQSYEQLFVTWKSFEPNSTLDQYLLTINARTKILEEVSYTVRDQMGFIVGHMIYKDYKKQDGILFPYVMRSVSHKDDPTSTFHEFLVSEVSWGAKACSLPFVPRPELSSQKSAHQ